MRKDVVKLLVKIIAFGIILLALFDSMGYLLEGSSRCYPMGRTARETDVIFLGSSHIYCNVIPQKLYDDFGITAWNVAPAEPGIKATYYALKEVNRIAKPKVVVVEPMMLYWDVVKENNLNMKTNFLHEMSLFSPIHYLAAFDCEKSYNIGIEYYFNILRAHTNYNKLRKENFDAFLGKDKKYIQLGYLRRDNRKKTSLDDVYSMGDLPKKGFEPDSENVQYLNKMMEYAAEENLNLIFLLAPDTRVSTHETFKWIDMYVNNHGFGIYDFNTKESMAAIDFDVNKDMADTNHLNDRGAVKFTEEIGNRIKNLYELPDHRGENGYRAWNEHQYNYQSEMIANKLNAENDVNNYSKNVNKLNEDYIVILCSKEEINATSNAGIAAGVTVLNGEKHYYNQERIRANIKTNIIESCIDEGTLKISINNKDEIKEKDAAAIIVVYSCMNNEIVDKKKIDSRGDFYD